MKDIDCLTEASHLLSVLFYEPSEVFADGNEEFFNEYENIVKTYCPEFNGLFKRLRNSFYDETFENLRVDHAALFFGPFKKLAYPYGSVYLESERLINGVTTKEVEKIYLKAGVEVYEDQKTVPDHIAIELEFIHFMLVKIQTEGDVQENKELLDTFVNNYFTPFADKLAQDIIEKAETEFYKTVGEMLKLFVERIK
jgi:TorA maturation chaperone TorD